MKGLILVNAYDDRPNVLNQAYRIKEELEKRKTEAEILRNGFLCSTNGRLNIPEGDFAVYLDKDKYTPLMLEKGGFRLFNPPSAVEACDDKMTTYIRLSNEGIPLPETFPAPLCYLSGERVNGKYLDMLEKELGYPMVIKESYGSLGKEVYLAGGREQLCSIAQKLIGRPHLFQKFISESAGRDMRVIVIGGKVAAAMTRKNAGDFRSNIERGGVGERTDVPQDVADMCIKAANILQLDYCGVDVLFGKDGYLLCEVNSNAFFGGMERVTGINVAALYAEHIIATISNK